jgi:hypothetical protein
MGAQPELREVREKPVSGCQICVEKMKTVVLCCGATDEDSAAVTELVRLG